MLEGVSVDPGCTMLPASPQFSLRVESPYHHRGQRTILAHVGSAHTDAQLGILLEQARRIAAEDQGVLDIEVAARDPTGR